MAGFRMRRRKLAMMLSTLSCVKESSLTLEQYPTESELASDMVWTAHSLGDIGGKRVADLGCGNGILGLGASIMGAREVFLVDIDEGSIEVAVENCRKIKKDLKGEIFFINCDIHAFNRKCDTVIMNPPFGSRKRHADRDFLLKSFKVASIVYSLHKKGNRAFFTNLDEEFTITSIWEKRIKIERMFEFHRKRRIEVEADYMRFERVK
jgi:putative methylase